MVSGQWFAVRLKLWGSWHVLATRIFFLFCSPHPTPQPLLSQSQAGAEPAGGAQGGWSGAGTPAHSLLSNDSPPALCWSLLRGPVWLFPGVNIAAVDDMTPVLV